MSSSGMSAKLYSPSADRIGRHAVDHDQQMIRLGAAHAELRQRAARAGLVDGDAGKRAHHVGELREAAGAGFLAAS